MKIISSKSKLSATKKTILKDSHLLNLQEISKIYRTGKNTNFIALDNISLQISQAEFLCILGKSGSGKTTLLNILSGLDSASSGNISFQGKSFKNLSDFELSKLRVLEIGFIFQDFNLLENLSVRDNILLPRLLAEKNGFKKQLKQKQQIWSVDQIMEMLEISEIAHNLPHQISGGQKQRATIGRALINSPSLILADEPTGNLDLETGLKIVELLKEIHLKQKISLIVVTHDQRIAQAAQRIVELQSGKIQT